MASTTKQPKKNQQKPATKQELLEWSNFLYKRYQAKKKDIK
jgi:hypothetical protein